MDPPSGAGWGRRSERRMRAEVPYTLPRKTHTHAIHDSFDDGVASSVCIHQRYDAPIGLTTNDQAFLHARRLEHGIILAEHGQALVPLLAMRQALASQVAEASLALQQVPRLQKMDCFSVLVGQEVQLRELKDVIGFPCALRL